MAGRSGLVLKVREFPFPKKKGRHMPTLFIQCADDYDLRVREPESASPFLFFNPPVP